MGAAGVYTIQVAAADPARIKGQYTLEVTGAGQETLGKVDPFSDRRDAGFVYDSVDLEVKNAGFYRVDLWAQGFHQPRLVLRDKDYGDVAADDGTGHSEERFGTHGIISVLNAGTYHIIIEDDLTGGDWRLMVTYLGGGS